MNICMANYEQFDNIYIQCHHHLHFRRRYRLAALFYAFIVAGCVCIYLFVSYFSCTNEMT